MSRKLWAALCASAFMMLGVAWAFASPHGSSADEDFHLVNIWCAWGDSEMCTLSPETLTATVPETIAYSWCYARWPAQAGAGCLNELTRDPVVTERISMDPWSYSVGFYRTMRVFAGNDISYSVQVMRLFNVALSSLLLFMALASTPWTLSRALSLSWGVAMIPLGIFFVASVNPSSWAIIGVGTFWVFLAAILSRERYPRKQYALLILGLALSTILALAARTDSGIYLCLATVAILIWRAKDVRERFSRRTLFTVGAPATALLAFTVWTQVRRYQVFPFSFPGAQTATDQPVPALKTLLEVPSFIFGLFGGQSARTMLRDTNEASLSEGYRPVGFIQGLGWTETQIPSLVGIVVGAIVFATVLLGWGNYSRLRAAAFALLGVAFLSQILLMRALFDFTAAAFIQPRYLFPLALVIIGIALARPGKSVFFNRFQALGVSALLLLAASIAWLAVSSRYAIGPNATYTNFGQQVEWWWSQGPGRLTSFVLATGVSALWLTFAAFLPGAGIIKKKKIPTSISEQLICTRRK